MNEHESEPETFRVCFVCLGNICRSPTAEGVMAHLVAESGAAVEAAVEVDSAGTGGYHNGSGPDPRSAAEAMKHGIDITGQQSRQVHAGDFAYFDLLIAMDESNLANLIDLAPTDEAAAKVRRLREFDPEANGDLDVPDPYYEDGFDGVFTMVERSCVELLRLIEAGEI